MTTTKSLKRRLEQLEQELDRRAATTDERQAAAARGVPLPHVERDDDGKPIEKPSTDELQAAAALRRGR